MCTEREYAFSGQGTISLELLEQIPQIDTIIVPISGMLSLPGVLLSPASASASHTLFTCLHVVGGGLISGVALAAKSINPAVRIFAAEPKGADDAAQSKKAGTIVTLPETKTIADGLRAFLGSLTW